MVPPSLSSNDPTPSDIKKRPHLHLKNLKIDKGTTTPTRVLSFLEEDFGFSQTTTAAHPTTTAVATTGRD